MISTLAAIIVLAIPIVWLYYSSRSGRFGAPWVTTDPEVVERVLALAEVKPGEAFYDLGSGDGRIVIGAALRGAQAYGVEVDKLRVWYSRLWIALLRLGKNARILEEDFFTTDLSGADVVSLFLLQETNDRLKDKLEKELKAGARVVSVAFDLPGWKPTAIDWGNSLYEPIYVYKR